MIDPPVTLPTGSLSVSSLQQLWKCPLRWKRRYIDNEWEPASPAMISGRATGAAASTNYQQKIESTIDLATADVLDAFSDEFELQCEQSEIEWDGARPGAVKDSAAEALTVYHARIAPTVQPTSVERQFSISWDGVDWAFKGYLDLEQSDGSVGDLKLRKRKLDFEMAKIEPQPTAYLLARASEGKPAPGFKYHVMQSGRSASAYVIDTARSEGQLDAFVQRIFAGAAEIDWRLQNDVWDGAVPGAWWCAKKWCGFWDTCPHGGRHGG